MTPSRSLARRARRLLSVVLVPLSAAGCDDPFRLTANRENVDAVFELWAMTGSPAAYPSGLVVAQATAVPLDALGSFDLAFDIDTTGRLKVYPVASVVSPLTGARQVEFQRATVPYSVVAEAPRTGWTRDSVLVVNVGQVFLVKVPTQYCQFDIRQEIYAKISVDSVDVTERRIRLGARVNPNCGFRSLLSGVPEF